MMLEAIVFDFDGVIVDSERLHYAALLEVMQSFDFSFTYETYIAKYVGFDGRDAFRTLLTDAGHAKEAANPNTIATLCQEKASAFKRVIQRGVQPISGVVELIHEAHNSGLPIAIASGSTRAEIEAVLHVLDLNDLFTTIVSANDVTQSKPHPMTYTQAVEQLSLSSGPVAAIEDTEAGIASAREAGLWVLGIGTLKDPGQLSQANHSVPDLRGVSLQTINGWMDGI